MPRQWRPLRRGEVARERDGARRRNRPEEIAKGLRAEEDVNEIAKLCADLVVAGSCFGFALTTRPTPSKHTDAR